MQQVLVNLSNHHIHLTTEDVRILFGEDATLTKKVDLLQSGQFAANETVTIKGPKGEITNIRVVGPTRSQTQCEILTGDTYKLGYAVSEVPVRLSGDLAGSAAFTIIGSHGSLHKPEGLIIAQRHIHIDPDTAKTMNLSDAQAVTLQLNTLNKRTDLHDVTVRAQPGAILECHIDVEEGNASGIQNGYLAKILNT